MSADHQTCAKAGDSTIACRLAERGTWGKGVLPFLPWEGDISYCPQKPSELTVLRTQAWVGFERVEGAEGMYLALASAAKLTKLTPMKHLAEWLDDLCGVL